MVKKGWLDRQIEQAQDEIKKWPEWMKREAGATPLSPSKGVSTRQPVPLSKVKSKTKTNATA